MATQLELEALRFAYQAHEGQRRKYTGDPYITHPIAVASMVKEAGLPPTVIAAALLHDVVEDTDERIETIEAIFGPAVANLVAEVTDVSKPEDGNRQKRKQIDQNHLAMASYEGQSIKCADLIHNTQSIVRYAPEFARVYLKEKGRLLNVLVDGNTDLYELAWKTLEEAQCLLDSQK